VTSLDTRVNALRFPLYPHEAETTSSRAQARAQEAVEGVVLLAK
jgi:hypothetical protein